MVEETKQTIPITLGDQSFRVRVRADEVERYERIAEVANGVLQDVYASGNLTGPRAMAMAVFQLAVELDETRGYHRDAQTSRERLNELIRHIDDATEDQAVT